MKIQNAEQALQNPEYKKALAELLYQLADDDFIISYRGSEWLGLAPHIEEDVAFSSISQDKMGHAALYYGLLEELGEGNGDYLAHGRPSKERRNAIILEEVNGPGDYLKDARYDWAFAVVRNYFYDLSKKVRLDSLKNSSYEPLSQCAVKISMEVYYHLLHWRTWFKQLLISTPEAQGRMIEAIHRVLEDFGGVLTLGPLEKEIVDFALIEPEEILQKRWERALHQVLEETGQTVEIKPAMKKGNGRIGEHSNDLESALATLSEVYESDPAAAW